MKDEFQSLLRVIAGHYMLAVMGGVGGNEVDSGEDFIYLSWGEKLGAHKRDSHGARLDGRKGL